MPTSQNCGFNTACRMLWAMMCSSLLMAAEMLAYTWVEAEAPKHVSAFEIKPDTRKPEIYSGGVCIFGSVAKEQIGTVVPCFTYDVDIAKEGEYQLWARIGMEWVRAPLDWRVDGGAWKTYSENELTTSLMQVAVWNELAWGRLGSVQLGPGRHSLQVRFERGNKDKLIFALDCFAFVADPNWRPDGKLKPGERYDVDKSDPKAFALPKSAGESGGRTALDLSGTWLLARWDDQDMDSAPFAPVEEPPPTEELNWMHVQVPGDLWSQRSELPFGHRMVYRTRIDVPESYAGRSAWLHFGGTNYVASVFVNGTYCGGRRSVLVPWDCDISKEFKSGQSNEVLVVVKSHYYAMDSNGKGGDKPVTHGRNLPKSFFKFTKWLDAITPSTKGEGDGTLVGIINPISVVVGGPAYASDVFIRTSVAQKRLAATIEITNPGSRVLIGELRCSAIHDASNAVAHDFAPVSVNLAAASSGKVEIGGEWATAKLWWPSEEVNDRPDCYRLRTSLIVDGRSVDVREDLFGFREITIKGKDFLLNGVPWRFNNWVDVPDKKRLQTPEDWIRAYHSQNDGFHRFSHDHSSNLGYREKAIAILDRLGVPSRCSTCIDGMMISQDLGNPVLWRNWEDHLRQVVRAYRNNPSIMHWSIGNEVMLINSHNRRRKEYLEDEKQMARLLAIAKEEDPTRDGYEDGAGDLGGLGPINNVHYSLGWWPDVPAQFYAYSTEPVQKRPGERHETFRWDGTRPWIGGEELFWAGRAANVAWIGGPAVYASNAEARVAASAYARMTIEGSRWQGAAGICPWTGPPTPDASKSFSRRAVFVREWNSCFAPGTTCKRTVLVVNDSRHPGDLCLRWKIVFDGKSAATGEKRYLLAPGQHQEDRLEAVLPAAQTRQEGVLNLELIAGGKVVFTDTKPISILPPPSVAPTKAPIIVVDHKGSLAPWLQAHKQATTRVMTPADLADDAGTVLVGPNAFTDADLDAWAVRLKSVVNAGGTVIVLEQAVPLSEKQLPTAIKLAGSDTKKGEAWGEFVKVGGASGSICHPSALTHGVFAGLQPRDFFTWSGDEHNYRLSYAVPDGGGVPLVVAGPELRYAPMIEIPLGAGSYLLSQLLVGSRIGVEPTADHLLANMLSWAVERASNPPRPVAVVGGDSAISEALGAIGVDQKPFVSMGEAMASDARVIVMPGRTELLEKLAGDRANLEAFCAAGRWILVQGIEPKSLAAFDHLTGVPHRIRPFRAEAVRVGVRGDPVLMGITDRDFNQRGYQMIAPWMRLYKVSKQVFSSVVDADGDITSFCEGLPGQLMDGLRSDDFWQYTACFASDGTQPIEIRMKQAEAVAGIEVWTSGAYYWPKEVTVVLDGDEAGGIKVTLADDKDKQVIPLPGKPISSVTIRINSVYEMPASKDLVTFDEIRLIRPVTPELAAKQIALTNPAGLVKYPRGKGGVVLSMLRLDERAEAAKESKDAKTVAQIEVDNIAKKRGILSNIIRNLGGAFVARPQTANVKPKKQGGKPERPPK